MNNFELDSNRRALPPLPPAIEPSAHAQRPIQEAVRSGMVRLISSKTIEQFQEAAVTSFRAVFCAVGQAKMRFRPPADDAEYSRYLRSSIPAYAAREIRYAAQDESLLGCRQQILINALRDFEKHIRPRSRNAYESILTGDALRLTDAIFAELASCVYQWPPYSVPADRAERVRRRQKDYAKFAAQIFAEQGITVNLCMLCRSAGVHRRDVGKWLHHGIHDVDSVISQRLQDVLEGRRPLIIKPSKSTRSATISSPREK